MLKSNITDTKRTKSPSYREIRSKKGALAPISTLASQLTWSREECCVISSHWTFWQMKGCKKREGEKKQIKTSFHLFGHEPLNVSAPAKQFYLHFKERCVEENWRMVAATIRFLGAYLCLWQQQSRSPTCGPTAYVLHLFPVCLGYRQCL